MLKEKYDLDGNMREALSYSLYPKVYEDYLKVLKNDGSFRYMGSDIYFHGLKEGETCEVKLEEGIVLVIKLVEVRNLDSEGMREVVFEVNGNRRSVKVKDNSSR